MRRLDQETVPLRHQEEIEQNLALWREQAGKYGPTVARRLDIVGDQPLQQFARLSARDLDHAAIHKLRRQTLAHGFVFCYLGDLRCMGAGPTLQAD